MSKKSKKSKAKSKKKGSCQRVPTKASDLDRCLTTMKRIKMKVRQYLNSYLQDSKKMAMAIKVIMTVTLMKTIVSI